MFTIRVSRAPAGCSPQRLMLSSAPLLPSTRHISSTPHLGASQGKEIKEFPKTYTHYQILGVDQNADSKAIKSAFRKLSKRFHPDMNQRVPTALKPIIKNNYIRVVHSYETLSNTTKRSQYDATLPSKSTRTQSFASATAAHSPTKQYSPGGINITRNRVHYGAGYRPCRSNHANLDAPPSGSNHDVPHFDYDTHLKGNLWFERRMIQKRFHKSTSVKTDEVKNEWFEKKFQNHNKKTVESEMNDTLNLQRYGGHYHRGQASYTITATPLVLTGLTILSMGIYLH